MILENRCFPVARGSLPRKRARARVRTTPSLSPLPMKNIVAVSDRLSSPRVSELRIFRDHARSYRRSRPIGIRREYLAAISHHYSRALQDGVSFSVAGRGGHGVIRARSGGTVGPEIRNVVSISVIDVEVAVHTYRRGAGSQKLMRGPDRRAARELDVSRCRIAYSWWPVRGGSEGGADQGRGREGQKGEKGW